MNKKLPFSIILLSILYEPVYAFSITQDIKLYTNILAVALIAIGLIIVIFGKISGGNKTIYIEKEKNLISGLTDEDKLKETKTFNPDSIFKVLPNFSSKKFEEETKEEINKQLKTEDNNFKINEFKIIDFKDEEDKYIIKAMVITETGTKNKEKSIYTTTSINKKETNKEVRCPVCGGKIKDLTKLRCTYCGSILPNNNVINNDEWTIESIDKN